MDKNVIVHKNLSPEEILRSKGLLSNEQTEPKTITVEEIQDWNEKVEEEQKKWDALDEVRQTDTGAKVIIKDILFEEALEVIKRQNLKDVSQPTVQKSRFFRFVSWLFGPKPLAKPLLYEQQLVFNITKVTIDNDNESHKNILQTIYRKLTKTKVSHPRFGPHWEEIGFQGTDPATDLRDTGFLSLLQLLFLVSKHSLVATEMFKLAVDPVHNFPFCLVSINVTRIALQALRDEKLSSTCKKRNEVLAVFNDFYLATFWHFFSIWKKEHKTMIDSGYVINALELYAMKNVPALMKTIPDLIKICKENQKQKEQYNAPINFSRLSVASTTSESTLNLTQEAVIQPQTQHIHQISTDAFEGVVQLSSICLQSK